MKYKTEILERLKRLADQLEDPHNAQYCDCDPVWAVENIIALVEKETGAGGYRLKRDLKGADWFK